MVIILWWNIVHNWLLWLMLNLSELALWVLLRVLKVYRNLLLVVVSCWVVLCRLLLSIVGMGCPLLADTQATG